MFRRSKSQETTTETVSVREGGKGRPTPTRREAQAATRARAKGAANKKDAKKLLRERRGEQNSKMREGMKTGEERYLPARDQGKVKRFIRDVVDSRLCMAELLLPLLIVIMITQTIGYQSFSNGLWSATILVVLLDTILLTAKIRRELKKRFPDEATKGTTFYAILRSLQLRFLRQPKTQVKLGQKLSDHY